MKISAIRRSTVSARNAKGSALIELGAIAFVLPLITIICVNVGVMVFAAWLNDSACRDAARAAAQRDNASDAYKVANLIVKERSANTGGLISSLILLGQDPGAGAATGKFFKYELFPDPATGEALIEKGPFVKVSTQLQASLPAPIVFNGAKFTNVLSFRQSYIFPIVNPTAPDSDDKGDDSDEIVTTGDDPDDKKAKDDALEEELDALSTDTDNDV